MNISCWKLENVNTLFSGRIPRCPCQKPTTPPILGTKFTHTFLSLFTSNLLKKSWSAIFLHPVFIFLLQNWIHLTMEPWKWFSLRYTWLLQQRECRELRNWLQSTVFFISCTRVATDKIIETLLLLSTW